MPEYFEERTAITRIADDNGTKEELKAVFDTLRIISTKEPYRFILSESFAQAMKLIVYKKQVVAFEYIIQCLNELLLTWPTASPFTLLTKKLFLQRMAFLIEDAAVDPKKNSFEILNESACSSPDSSEAYPNKESSSLAIFDSLLKFFAAHLTEEETKNKRRIETSEVLERLEPFEYLTCFQTIIRMTLESPKTCKLFLDFMNTLPKSFKDELIDSGFFENTINPSNFWEHSIAESRIYLEHFLGTSYDIRISLPLLLEDIKIQDTDTQLHFLQSEFVCNNLQLTTDISFINDFLIFFNELSDDVKIKWIEQKEFHAFYNRLIKLLEASFDQTLFNHIIPITLFLERKYAGKSWLSLDSFITLESFFKSINALPFDRDAFLPLIVMMAKNLPSSLKQDINTDRITERLQIVLHFISVDLIYAKEKARSDLIFRNIFPLC